MQEAPWQLCRPWEDPMDILLELPVFNICSQTPPQKCGASKVQTHVEWWSEEYDLDFGKDKWVGNAPVRAVIPAGLSSTSCTSHHTGGSLGAAGWAWALGNHKESSSRAGPPAQLMSSPLLSINLLIQEQLLPSHFRFANTGFSFLNLQMVCLQFLLLCRYNDLGKICHVSEILVTQTQQMMSH